MIIVLKYFSIHPHKQGITSAQYASFLVLNWYSNKEHLHPLRNNQSACPVNVRFFMPSMQIHHIPYTYTTFVCRVSCLNSGVYVYTLYIQMETDQGARTRRFIQLQCLSRVYLEATHFNNPLVVYSVSIDHIFAVL